MMCNCGRPMDGSHDHASCGPPVYTEEDICPDPQCPVCNGTGFTDVDTGISVDVNMAYRLGAYVNAHECYACMSEDAIAERYPGLKE